MRKSAYPLKPMEYAPRNQHRAFEKLRQDTNTVVVFLHGFLGSPNQFASLAQYVYDLGYASAAPLLPGHGGTARDFAKSSRWQWVDCVHESVHRYADLYPNVFLVGHSMGGLLAICESTCNKAHVKGLILMNTAVKIHLKSRPSLYGANNFFSRHPIYNRIDRYYKENNSVQVEHLPQTLGWMPRVMDLVGLSRQAVRVLPQVKVPVLITQSRKDEAVLWRSAEMIANGLINCPYRKLVYLQRSWHSYYFKREQQQLQDEIKCFLDICRR